MSEALSEAQRAVVNAGGGVALVLAGAGTGKTRTLTRRLERLLRLGVAPGAICLVTFTNRAAADMMERLAAYGLGDLEDLWGGTFHSLAARALRLHGGPLGFPADFTILEPEDAERAMAEAQAAVGSSSPELTRAGPRALLKIYEACLQRVEPLGPMLATLKPRLLPLEGTIRDIFAAYMGLKARYGVLDFDDLLLGLRRVLQVHKAQGVGLARQFEHVLVDELQDTSRLQLEIVELLGEFSGNLMAVGDDLQSIYGFRGADPELMRDFARRHARCRVMALEVNYRSTPEILALASASIAHNRRQHPKALRAALRSGERPAVVSCRDDAQQARFVAQRVAELVGQGRALAEIAVLYRAHFHGLAVQEELTARGVAFGLHSGLAFFEKAHVKDLLALLKWRHNPRDGVSMARCLGLLPGVGARGVEVIRAACLARAGAGSAAALAGGASAASGRARASAEGLAALMAAADGSTPGDWVAAAVEGWFGALCVSSREDQAARKADLEEAASWARGFGSLGAMLEAASLMTSERGRVLVNAAAGADRLCLSTIHKAKGLEWPVVFVVGVAEGRFPRGWEAPPEAEMEEERRLLHVAMTRARELLVLTWPRSGRTGGGQTIGLGPSPLLKELGIGSGGAGSPLVEVWRLEEGDDQATPAP